MHESSACGLVGGVLASNTRGPRFESSHRQTLFYLCTVSCIQKTKMTKMRLGKSQVFNYALHWRTANCFRSKFLEDILGGKFLYWFLMSYSSLRAFKSSVHRSLKCLLFKDVKKLMTHIFIKVFNRGKEQKQF